MRRRSTIALLAVLTAVALTACDNDQSDGSDAQTGLSAEDAVEGTEVDVVDNRFEPAVLAIQPGDTVTWTWRGEAPHDVAGDDFESEVLTDGTFTHTFEDPGEYPYVCTIHTGMEALIVVEEG